MPSSLSALVTNTSIMDLSNLFKKRLRKAISKPQMPENIDRGMMDEGGRDVEEWVKGGKEQSRNGLARLLKGTIPDLKGTLGQGLPPVETEMQIIVTVDDLRNMLSAQQAVVFVDVDWSMTSVEARQHVRDFIEAWNHQNSGVAVTFYHLNLTEQEGPLWNATGDWLNTQSAPTHIMSDGAGALIWVSKGKIDHYLLNSSTSNTTELIEQTRRTFKETAASAHDKKQEGKNP